MRATILLINKIYKATGVNVTFLNSDEWRHINPLAQRMLIQEYLKETHKMDGSDGVHIPDNYADLLVEAINYFFEPTSPDFGKDTRPNSMNSKQKST